jgi:hypothetical protein
MTYSLVKSAIIPLSMNRSAQEFVDDARTDDYATNCDTVTPSYRKQTASLA